MEAPFGVYDTSYNQELSIVRTKPQWIALGIGLAALAVLPAVLSAEWVTWLTVLAVYAVAVLGLHFMLGLAGLFSMGQGAFMAIGAYTAAIMGTTYGWPAWATLPLAGLVAGLAGALFALPALRIKGFYLVIATLAAQFVVLWAIKHFDWTGGASGMYVPQIAIGGERLGDVGLCWLALGIMVVMTIAIKNLQRTNTGRQMIALRDNDIAAEVMGVNLLRTKVLAFFIGCVCAGVAGWLWAYFAGYLNVDQFGKLLSLKFLAMVVVGGMGSTAGAIMGTTLIMFVDKVPDYIVPVVDHIIPAGQIGPALSFILYAGLVVFFIIREPKGLYSLFQRVRLWLHLHPFSY